MLQYNGKKSCWFSFIAAIQLCAIFPTRADTEGAVLAGTNADNEMRTMPRVMPKTRTGGEGERLIDRLLANQQLTAELGLSNETVVRLRDETRQNQNRRIDLEAQIRKLSLEQTDHMAKLLSDANANTNEVMKSVEEIGHLRTELAKLEVQNLLVIRKHLTPEQISRARILMYKRALNNASRHEKINPRPANQEREKQNGL